MAKITDKVRFGNPPITHPHIVGFWIADEIVCLQCITEEEGQQPITEEDIIYRKYAEEIDLFCDRCERPLIRDS